MLDLIHNLYQRPRLMKKFNDEEYNIEDNIEEVLKNDYTCQSSETVSSNRKSEQPLLIDFKGVEIRRDDKIVLKDVDFQLRKGEFCYLVGRVGSGKSSLMKAMYAEVPIDVSEKSEVMDFELKGLKRRKRPLLRRKIGIVFQDFQLLTDRSVNANLRFVLQATGWKKKDEIERRIEGVLEAVGMSNKSYKMPHELSGGEQQRIVIARALLNKPDLIIADEPTGNLDPQTGYNIVSLLHELSQKGQAIIMATHNMQLVDDFPARVVRCEDKQLVETTAK